LKGRSETSGVTLIVGFLLAVAAISVMTDAMSGMLTQTSETSETDQLSEIANDISKQCENAVADNPIGGDYETEVKISPGTVLRFPGGSNRRLEAEIAATEDSRSWQIPDECEYEFTGEGSGDTFEADETNQWYFGFTDDSSEGNPFIRTSNGERRDRAVCLVLLWDR